MHNVPAITWNAIVSVAKKVEDNILHIITAPIVMQQPAALQDPVANPPSALLKAPNTLIIKQIHIPMGKLNVTKPWLKPAEARAQQQHQPYLPISIAPWQVTWGDKPKGRAT